MPTYLTGIIVKPEQMAYVNQHIIQCALQEQDGRVLQHVRCNGDRFCCNYFCF